MSQALLALLFSLKILIMPVIVTNYGIDDEFTGKRTASSWHNMTPPGAPEVVDNEYYGAASNDFAFGTVLHVRVAAECSGELLERSSAITVTVVDRLANGITGYVDLWPAPARDVGLGRDGCALGSIK